MLSTADHEETYATLQDPALAAWLHCLRQTDNVTNWRYFLGVFLFLAVDIDDSVLEDEQDVDGGAIEAAL